MVLSIVIVLPQQSAGGTDVRWIATGDGHQVPCRAAVLSPTAHCDTSQHQGTLCISSCCRRNPHQTSTQNLACSSLCFGSQPYEYTGQRESVLKTVAIVFVHLKL